MTTIQNDVDLIGQLTIVPSLLNIICKTTGMGFAAIARVTDDRWVACAVKDNISFGLNPGGELHSHQSGNDRYRQRFER